MITGKKEYFINNIFNDERLKEVSIKINYECLLYLINHYKKCRKLLKPIIVRSFRILSSYGVHWENPAAFIDYDYDTDDYDFYYMDNELNILDNYNKETVLKYAVLNEDYFIVDMTAFKNDNKLTLEEYWYDELFKATMNEKGVSMFEIKKCVIDCLNEASEATNNSFRRQGLNLRKDDVYSENYEAVNEDKEFLVLFSGLDPVGSAEIYKDFSVLHIKSFAILEKYQNMGYGTRFLEKIYEWAKKYRFKEMRLQVANNNEKALSIYKEFGFEPFSMAMFAKIEGEDNEKSEIK